MHTVRSAEDALDMIQGQEMSRMAADANVPPPIYRNHVTRVMLDVEMNFFFSSRGRHTRCYRYWSSDVCSSDLPRIHLADPGQAKGEFHSLWRRGRADDRVGDQASGLRQLPCPQADHGHSGLQGQSDLG